MKLSGHRQAIRVLAKGSCVLVLIFFCYVLGGAAIYFRVSPAASFLEQAFTGGKAWWEKRREAAEPVAGPSWMYPEVDRPEKTFDGFTVYTTTSSSRALLIDMRGKIVHQWSVRFSEVWPEPKVPHVEDPVPDDRVCFWGCRVLPNGDLVAVLDTQADTPYGYGLVRLDKDSRVRWRYSANAHHELDIGADGKIYAVTQKIVRQVPKGLESIAVPCLVDYLVVLSGTGQELEKIPILEAFRDSPYAEFLDCFDRMSRGSRKVDILGGHSIEDIGDILHTNYVQVLTPELVRASRIPNLAPGQVLVSIRNQDTVVVIDTALRRVVWAARGPWHRQHSAQFLGNGHLLLFDNLGSPNGSRVLEYDPLTHAVPWSYPSDLGSAELLHREAGMVQRLPDGNTLIVHPQMPAGLTEITPQRELVWSCRCVSSASGAGPGSILGSGRRYAAQDLPFLKNVASPRP